MRELLARAAHDHVYEQRSTGQVLDEINQRLEAVEWLLREQREREAGESRGRAPDWAEGLAEHIESVGEKVKPVAELPSLWADIGVISENVDESLIRAQAVLDSNRTITETTLQAVRQMDELTKRLDRLAGTMEAASVRFNRLDKALADLGHRSEKLENELTGVAARVDRSLREMAERVEQGLEAVHGRVEGIGGRLNGLDGRLEGLSGTIGAVVSSFEGLERKVDVVDDRIEAVSQRVGRLPATLDIHEMHRKLTALGDIDPTDRFDALEKRLAEAVDPLIDELRHVALIQGDVLGKVGGVHDDLTKRLFTLEETMLALAEALFRPRRESKE